MTKTTRKRRLVSPQFAFDVIGVSSNTGYKLIKNGEIPAVEVGRQRPVPVAWLEEKACVGVGGLDDDIESWYAQRG